MATIQITPELLHSKASEVRTLKEDHDQTMQKLTTLVHGLSDQWKGDAQTAYVSKYDEMQSTFTNFSNLLEGYAKLMDTSADEMFGKDQDLKSTINSFNM